MDPTSAIHPDRSVSYEITRAEVTPRGISSFTTTIYLSFLLLVSSSYTESMRLVRRRRRTPRPPLTAHRRKQREIARGILLQRVEQWSMIMGILPKRVAIRDQRTRWGSASTLGNVNFSWRVAAMPDEIQDYIVIHELAHLREMNHSSAFWEIVAAHCPEYRQHRAWLRKYGTQYHRTLV